MTAREALWSTPLAPTRSIFGGTKRCSTSNWGNTKAALALYAMARSTRATQRPLSLSLTNATALLWRLDTLGCDVGDRWQELAVLWEEHADGKCLVFADIHAAMAELRSGREALVERRLTAMRKTAASGVEAAGLYRAVGIPIVKGLTAFHRGAYDHAVEMLLPVRVDLWQIGGSYAQRDVVNWTSGPKQPYAPVSGKSPCHSPMNVWRAVRAVLQTGAFCAMRRNSPAERGRATNLLPVTAQAPYAVGRASRNDLVSAVAGSAG